MSRPSPIVYLHGFSSSPNSTKARFFAQRFSELEIPFAVPQLDRGDFSRLTIGGQLEVIEETCGERPVILMGSSLGGYLAAIYGARHPSVEKLVLMAPAFEVGRRWREWMSSADLERWEREGSFPFFHYGEGREVPLHYGFLKDLENYKACPEFRQPALVFHGRQDSVVPLAITEAFAARHSNVEVRALNAGHELTEVLDILWEETARFLGLPNLRPVLE